MDMSTTETKYKDLHDNKKKEILDIQRQIRELQINEQKAILELARLEGALTVLEELKTE